MAVANAVSYVFVLLLSRAFGPADFGGYSALSTYGLILSVPAGAFQVVVARHVAARDHRTDGVRLALWFGIALSGLTVALSPVLTDVFRLESIWSTLWLGLTLVPMTLTGACQGILLGTQRIGALSSLYLVTAAGRLLVGVCAALMGWSVVTVFFSLFLATVGTAVYGAVLCRNHLRTSHAQNRQLTVEMFGAIVSLGAFIALTNSDVVLARAYLDDHDSGGYALAATFGRAVCWLTQFAALLVVPRLQGTRSRAYIIQGNGAILVLGSIGLIIMAIHPEFWMRLAGGAEYVEFATLATACVALGVAWALVQLWLFIEMGRNLKTLGLITWVVLVGQVVAISLFFHESAFQIVAVNAVGALTIVAIGLARAVLLNRSRPRHDQLGPERDEPGEALAEFPRNPIEPTLDRDLEAP